MEPISILWPGEKHAGTVDFSGCAEDLQLGELSALLFAGRSCAEALEFAQALCTSDQEVIQYRQKALQDLLEHPALIDAFETVRSLQTEIRTAVLGIRENAGGFTSGGVMNGFKETLGKLERLFGSKSNMIEESDLDNYYGQLFRAAIFSCRLAQAYVELLKLLRQQMAGAAWKSEAMKSLQHWVEQLYLLDRVEESGKVLEEIEKFWAGVGAFSVDILVDREFHILGMELASVQPEHYARPGVMSCRPGEKFDGIAALTDFPMGGATARFQECVITELGSALRSELFKLRSMVERIPVSAVQTILTLEDEISFYIGTARFCQKLSEKGGCVASPAVSDDCFMEVEGGYPVALMLVHGESPAVNDIRLPRGGTINFVTGANSSGKTTWLIAAGQIQWLYQLGCHLPCERAAMSPVDGLYTLFASGESMTGEDSRMGMEAIKLSQFRDKMTECSVVLLNEPMTSTNAGEGIEICMDLLFELMEKRVSGMIVTHYNELFSMLTKKLVPMGWQDRLQSFVMEIEETDGVIRYPYRLRQRMPDRSSHADEIVRQMGVTLKDMLQRFSAAGLDVRPNEAAWLRLHNGQQEV